MDREQRTESPFNKALSYLNFSRGAKVAAHLTAGSVGVVLVALLIVLWLFADLMVWRGRVPAAGELSPKQLGILEREWAEKSPSDRADVLRASSYDDAEAKRAAEVEFLKLTPEQRQLVWEDNVWETLRNRVGSDAIEHVFLESKDTRTGYVMDSSDFGVLSLVVREEASGRLLAPAAWMARWNKWMWNAPAGEPRGLPSYLTGLALLALILGLLWGMLVVLNREMAARATVEATNRLRRAVYHHTFRLGNLAVRALGPSEAVSVLTRHIEALHEGLYVYLTVQYREPITFALLLAFAFLVEPLLALAFLLFALIVWQVGLRLVAATRSQARRANNVAAERLTIIRESLMMMRLVKVYMMDQFNQARIERQLTRYGQIQRVRHRGESLARPALVLLAGAAVLVLLYVGGLLTLYGQLAAATAFVLVVTLLSLIRPASTWLEGRKHLKRGREAAEQVFGFLERRGDVGQVVGAEFLPPLAKLVEFDNVNLREPGTNRALLENVSLSIPAGQRIGLVSAESQETHALVYLIPRLLDPTSGEIRIDQHNLRWVTLDSLRVQVGLVMMHNLVFHDTIRDNIGCGDPTYTLPRIIEAAKMAHAHNFIQKLPNGYETPIGELGHALSLSEQYRIALARAILRDPALLIIEEPETELDDDTKNLLDDTLSRILPGRTAIFLPHRISTLKACNAIHLVSKGKVVDTGTHRELLARNKLYRHLHYLEFNQMDEVV